MVVIRPVVADRSDGVFGISQTTVVGMKTCRRILIWPTVASPESLADDEWPVHDDAKVSVSPTQADVSKRVLEGDCRGFLETSWYLLDPWLYTLLIELHELLGARQRLANHSGVYVICGQVKGCLYTHTSIGRDIVSLGRIAQRIRCEFLVKS